MKLPSFSKVTFAIVLKRYNWISEDYYYLSYANRCIVLKLVIDLARESFALKPEFLDDLSSLIESGQFFSLWVFSDDSYIPRYYSSSFPSLLFSFVDFLFLCSSFIWSLWSIALEEKEFWEENFDICPLSYSLLSYFFFEVLEP